MITTFYWNKKKFLGLGNNHFLKKIWGFLDDWGFLDIHWLSIFKIFKILSKNFILKESYTVYIWKVITILSGKSL